jgi:DNA-binding CsgD family transcriptional regulator
MSCAPLKPIDHQILLALIRGVTMKALAQTLHLQVPAVATRIARARKRAGCRTTYELIALETISLMLGEGQVAPLYSSS